MSSKLEVWKASARLLGMESPTSDTPSNEATRAFNEAWEGVVKSCLEVGDWDCARERDELSRVLPAPAFGWDYYYAIPADSLRLVYVSQSGQPRDPLLHYEIEKGKIATNATTVYAIWISSTAIDTPGRWSENLAKYVAATLAKQCLKLNPSAKDDVDRELKATKPAAEGVDATQNPPSFRRPGQWVSAIRGGRSREQG